MKLKNLVAIVLTASVLALSGCYDYNYNGGGHPYWYNHGWYGGDRFYHNGSAFGHEFGGHYAGHDFDHNHENHNDHNDNHGHQ